MWYSKLLNEMLDFRHYAASQAFKSFISGVVLDKSQRLRFICTMKKLSVASRNQTRRNK